MEQAKYTVRVWFKDWTGKVNEKKFEFTAPDIAGEFVYETKCALTRLRKTGAISANGVECQPPLPH